MAGQIPAGDPGVSSSQWRSPLHGNGKRRGVPYKRPHGALTGKQCPWPRGPGGADAAERCGRPQGEAGAQRPQGSRGLRVQAPHRALFPDRAHLAPLPRTHPAGGQKGNAHRERRVQPPWRWGSGWKLGWGRSGMTRPRTPCEWDRLQAQGRLSCLSFQRSQEFAWLIRCPGF